MRISDSSSDVCSSDLQPRKSVEPQRQIEPERGQPGNDETHGLTVRQHRIEADRENEPRQRDGAGQQCRSVPPPRGQKRRAQTAQKGSARMISSNRASVMGGCVAPYSGCFAKKVDLL